MPVIPFAVLQQAASVKLSENLVAAHRYPIQQLAALVPEGFMVQFSAQDNSVVLYHRQYFDYKKSEWVEPALATEEEKKKLSFDTDTEAKIKALIPKGVKDAILESGRNGDEAKRYAGCKWIDIHFNKLTYPLAEISHQFCVTAYVEGNKAEKVLSVFPVITDYADVPEPHTNWIQNKISNQEFFSGMSEWNPEKVVDPDDRYHREFDKELIELMNRNPEYKQLLRGCLGYWHVIGMQPEIDSQESARSK